LQAPVHFPRVAALEIVEDQVPGVGEAVVFGDTLPAVARFVLVDVAMGRDGRRIGDVLGRLADENGHDCPPSRSNGIEIEMSPANRARIAQGRVVSNPTDDEAEVWDGRAQAPGTACLPTGCPVNSYLSDGMR